MRLSTKTRRGRYGVAMLAMLVALMAGVPGGTIALRVLAQGLEESPARGHAQVVAQGVAALPADGAVWRVVYHEAQLPDDAADATADLGFLIADQGAMTVLTTAPSSRTHLTPGEAMFVGPGISQRRESSGDRPAGYFAIELVAPDQAADVGDGIAVFAGESFTPSEANREWDLDLVRDVLTEGEVATLPAGEGQTLVLVTAGSLQVQAGGDALPLRVGQAATFEGELQLEPDGIAGATYVAAVIGGSFDPIAGGATPSAASPVASPIASPVAATPVAPTTEAPTTERPAAGEGQIAVTILACPEGSTPTAFNPDDCLPDREVVELAIFILGSGDEERTLDDAELEAATARWTELPYGDYLLRATEFGEGYGRFFVAGLEGLNSPPENGYTAGPNEGYQVPLSADTPDYQLDVYAFPGGATGTIAYEVVACPPGATVAGLDPALCTPATEGAIVALDGGDLEAPLTVDQTTVDEAGRRVWSDLNPGEYIVYHALPDGYVGWAIPESPIVTILPDGSGYSVTLEPGSPPIVLTLFDIEGAPAPEPTPVPEEPAPQEPVPTDAPPPPPPAFPPDADGDGLSDDEEVNIYGTDPGLFDTDFDGFGDYDEVFNGTNPLDPGSVPPPAA